MSGEQEGPLEIAAPKELAPLLPPSREMDVARLRFVPETPDDTEVLIAWLSTDTWPFHGTAHPTAEQVRGWLAEPDRDEATTERYWAVLDEAVRVGRVVIEDLGDLTAVVSFRIRTAYRGRGIGLQMVRWVADHVFGEFVDVKRLEGQTRVDNVAMCSVFRRAGWVAEAYYRRAWPDEDGAVHDGVGYAILRDDWANGTVMPVPWLVE